MTGSPSAPTGPPMPATALPRRARRVVVRTLAAALLGLLAAPLGGCSSGGSGDTCLDVAKNACDRVAECGALTGAFGTAERCEDSFGGLFRSQGATDACIAFELGHTSGGACVTSTYGGVPESWRNGGGPNLKWMPEGKG